MKTLNFWQMYAVYSGEAKINVSLIAQAITMYKNGDRSSSLQNHLENIKLDKETKKEWEDYYGQ